MIEASSIETFRFFIEKAKQAKHPFVILGNESKYPKGGNWANGTGYGYKYLMLSSTYTVYFHHSFFEGEGSVYADILKLPEYQKVESLNLKTEVDISCKL